MKQTIHLSLEGEADPVVVTAEARDLIEWEISHDASFFDTRLSFRTLAELAWLSMRRQGRTTESFDVFRLRCLELSGVEEPETRPTPRGATAGSSANSHSGSGSSPRASRRRETPSS